MGKKIAHLCWWSSFALRDELAKAYIRLEENPLVPLLNIMFLKFYMNLIL